MEKQYPKTVKDNKLNDEEEMNKNIKTKKPVVKEKVEEKTEEVVKKEVIQKEVAVVNGFSIRISPKSSKYICKAIMRKNIDGAIDFLELVVLKKKAIPMNGAEIPHRKGIGMMSGRYPVNAANEFILLLKQLKANAVVNGIDNPIITLAIANKAQLPYKKDGKRGKRTHIYLEAIDKNKMEKKR